MRILVDLPEATIDRLTTISRRQRKPRAAVIREALDRFTMDQDKIEQRSDEAFGAWGDGEDGLSMQQRLRSEW